MWEYTSPLSIEQTWTLAFPSVKIAGSRNTLLLHIEFKVWNMSNTIVLTRWSITNTSYGAANWTSRLIYLDLKQNKGNYIPIISNTVIVRTTIKLTPTYILSGNISSIENGTQRNIKKSVITGVVETTRHKV